MGASRSVLSPGREDGGKDMTEVELNRLSTEEKIELLGEALDGESRTFFEILLIVLEELNNKVILLTLENR